MSARDALSSLPPAILRAALDASEERVRIEKRIKKEKERIRGQIQELQKRLDELNEQSGTPEIKLEEDEIAASPREAKRFRIDSPNDGEVAEEDGRRPIAKVQKVDPRPAIPQRLSCTRCRMKGANCEWDEVNLKVRRCLACSRTKYGCDLKRPSHTDGGVTHAPSSVPGNTPGPIFQYFVPATTVTSSRVNPTAY